MPSLNEWKDFLSHPCYVEILHDIAERDAEVSKCLRYGDHSMGNDDTLRGRLNELEYIKTIADAFIEELELLENTQAKQDLNKETEDEDSERRA